MASNASQGGSAFRGRYPDLSYYDKLPPTARVALANAAFDWSSGWVYGQWATWQAGLSNRPRRRSDDRCRGHAHDRQGSQAGSEDG